MRINDNTKKFIAKHGFASVTIGFLVAHSGASFIESVITGFIMPLIQPFIGEADWSVHEVKFGEFSFMWGKTVANGIHLLLVIFIAVLLIKLLEYEEAKKE